MLATDTDWFLWSGRSCALDDPDLIFKREGGGFPRLDRLFGGELAQVLDAFNDALWQQPAAWALGQVAGIYCDLDSLGPGG